MSLREELMLREAAIWEALGGPGSGCHGNSCGRPPSKSGDTKTFQRFRNMSKTDFALTLRVGHILDNQQRRDQQTAHVQKLDTELNRLNSEQISILADKAMESLPLYDVRPTTFIAFTSRMTPEDVAKFQAKAEDKYAGKNLDAVRAAVNTAILMGSSNPTIAKFDLSNWGKLATASGPEFEKAFVGDWVYAGGSYSSGDLQIATAKALGIKEPSLLSFSANQDNISVHPRIASNINKLIASNQSRVDGKITVYRGTDTKSSARATLESWTKDPDVAGSFGRYVAKAEVSARQIAMGHGISKYWPEGKVVGKKEITVIGARLKPGQISWE